MFTRGTGFWPIPKHLELVQPDEAGEIQFLLLDGAIHRYNAQTSEESVEQELFCHSNINKPAILKPSN